jgi:predicted  nucleic acid-binding Zn-ribbon protein
MTKTEHEIQEIKRNLATLLERVDFARNEIASGQKVAEKLETTVEKLREALAAVQTRVEVVAAGFDDFKKRWDESDRRRWTVYGVMLAAALTFVANLVLLFLKR